MTIQTDILQSNLAAKPIVMQDANGVEVGQVCTAWCVFNGVTGALTSSFNVASVVRNAIGSYTITFSTPMTSSAYSITSMAGLSTNAATAIWTSSGSNIAGYQFVRTVTQCSVVCCYSTSNYLDGDSMTVAIFGG